MPSNETDLAGQLAVVTGAAEGIGAAIVGELLAAGADVVAVDVKEIEGAMIEARRRAVSQKVRVLRCDVTVAAEIKATCAAILSERPASILVNNVGGSGMIAAPTLEELTDEIWEHVLTLNLGSTMRFCRALVPGMKALGGGRIINISSSLKDGIRGPADTLRAPLPYVAAKSALTGLTRQLAIELGPFGITVNAIAPGLTLPDENAKITRRFRALSPETQQRLTAGIPLRRPATGADIANAVRFLAHPSSGYVSGEVISVSGGA